MTVTVSVAAPTSNRTLSVAGEPAGQDSSVHIRAETGCFYRESVVAGRDERELVLALISGHHVALHRRFRVGKDNARTRDGGPIGISNRTRIVVACPQPARLKHCTSSGDARSELCIFLKRREIHPPQMVRLVIYSSSSVSQSASGLEWNIAKIRKG